MRITENLPDPRAPRLLAPVRHALALLFAGFALLASSGCMPTMPTEKLMDAAYDHNTALRFGRMDVALEHVAAASREDWKRKHAEWGGRVRVLDLELSDIRMKARDKAEVRVRVEWQHVDEMELRSTELLQKWSHASGWRMETEECTSGDRALLEHREDTDALKGAPVTTN